MTNNARTAKLTIKNAEYYGYHGVRDEERALGGRYQIDAELTYDASKAVVSDDISDAVNYEDVLFRIREHVAGEPYNLIETMAFDIGVSIIETMPTVQMVTIRVRKLNVPIQQVMESVQAEITVARKEKA
jgi:7,8-dihydroneopterin aldolase/epimerase/oxygenase